MYVCMQVEFLTKITGMKPGPELHKKLARVLAGQDEGQDILDPEKVRQLDNYVARSNSVTSIPLDFGYVKYTSCKGHV